jgi:hypothetical protein
MLSHNSFLSLFMLWENSSNTLFSIFFARLTCSVINCCNRVISFHVFSTIDVSKKKSFLRLFFTCSHASSPALQTDGRWCRKKIVCVGFPAICGSSQSKPGVGAPGFFMILTLNYTNKNKDLIIFFE